MLYIHIQKDFLNHQENEMFMCNPCEVGQSEVKILALSPEDANKLYGLTNWSLQPIQNQQDAYSQYGLTKLAAALQETFQGMGTSRVYAPHVIPASAVVTDTAALKERIRLGEGVSLYRNRDAPADGVFLQRGDAFAMSAAGCPVIIATAGKRMIVAHAGRDSLIERAAVMGAPARKHLSIVNAIVEAFKKQGTRAGEISMRMYFSIPTLSFEHRFDHPQYGAYNRALAAFIDDRWEDCMARRTDESMFLSLESVFVEQARQAGVRDLLATLSLDECLGLAHTRDEKDPRRRNLILVKRST